MALPGLPAAVEPVGKRGHSCAVHGDKLYVQGGYYRGLSLFSPPSSKLDVFDFTTFEWSSVSTLGEKPRAMSGSCSVVIGDCLYLFGGWYQGWRNDEVHQLNLKKLEWQKLTKFEQEGRPLCKDKAGMVDYGEEILCVFGGYGHSMTNGFVKQPGAGYQWDPKSVFELCWTNELHLFQIKSREWIWPTVTGKRPPPCAAFSFTRVDRHRVVLFGGRQLQERTDQMYILDMEQWHWSEMILPNSPHSPWPGKCSFHSACPLVDPNSLPHKTTPTDHTPFSGTEAGRRHPWLPCATPDLSGGQEDMKEVDPKLLVLWGMDNDGEPVGDVWMLNVNSLTWKKIVLPGEAMPPRIWHTACCYYPIAQTAMVMVMGGASSNLFSQEESSIQNIGKTLLLDFGVSPSLYELVLRFMAEDLEFFTPHLCHLPRVLREAVQGEHDTLSHRELLSYRHCSKIGS